MSIRNTHAGSGPGFPRRGRRAALLACTLIAAAGIAGCGEDDEPMSATEPATATEEQPVETPAAEPADVDEVEIAEFLFEPEAITVEAGTKVTWTNADTAPHTASADDSSFDTGTLDKSDSGSATFDEPGTYSYYCRFHPFMKGTVEVR